MSKSAGVIVFSSLTHISIGRQGRLSVSVFHTDPEVTCVEAQGGKPPARLLCPQVLSRMLASDDLRTFGEEGTPNIDVGLPVKYADGKYFANTS